MRAIWKGAVSFGLVNVPVKLYTATESHDVSFRQVHVTDGGRIRYQRVCSVDGEEVDRSEIAKGYEMDDGEVVVLTDDDFSELPTSTSREISVERFVPSSQIDPLLFEKSYYLEPDAAGSKAYALLLQALKETDRVAVVTVSLRQRTSMALLRVRETEKGDVIVLQTMMWPDEVRTPDFSVDAGEVKESEVTMAQMLVDTLAGDFDPSSFEDDYAEAVQALVKAKVEGGEITRTAQSPRGGGEVVDLLAALQKSVNAAKRARGEDVDADEDAPADQDTGAEDADEDTGSDTEQPARTSRTGRGGSRRTAKKAAPKKSAPNKEGAAKAGAKKTAAQKTAAKKSPARKSASRATRKSA